MLIRLLRDEWRPQLCSVSYKYTGMISNNEPHTAVCHSTSIKRYYSLFRHEWLAQGVTQKIAKYIMRHLEDELHFIIHCA